MTPDTDSFTHQLRTNAGIRRDTAATLRQAAELLDASQPLLARRLRVLTGRLCDHARRTTADVCPDCWTGFASITGVTGTDD